jgi:FMN phosphatase YigB (HAD superfamily)
MRVLLFDVFGTLVDWRSSLIETDGLDHLADALGC